ncbi:MAG TPA: hypothetical protein PKN21_04025, partial [Bacteroidales bacterium]|nr:hypothetical protein [Bacteroidales bacterium]
MYKRYIPIFALLILAWPGFAARPVVSTAQNTEKVVLITDRSVYITTEQVKFFASLSAGKDLSIPVESEILYCEIITPDGNRIAGNKYQISDNSVSGCIDIPENLVSGAYYIRAYTKVMRNNGPESFGYNQVIIINPYRDEVLAKNNKSQGTAAQVVSLRSRSMSDALFVSADKNSYTARENVTVSLSLAPAGDDDENVPLNNVCLSVIPGNYISKPVAVVQTNKKITGKTDYYPETRGLSITGKLTQNPAGVPVIDKKVNLSIIGEGRDFMSARTDSTGQFHFAMPSYSGTRDLFVCAEKIDSVKVKIWVDNDFCTLPVQLPSPAINLSADDLKNLQDMAQNVQISAHYYTDSAGNKRKPKTEKYPFYGKPTNIIYIDKYIQLPTLEEYFNELPSEVKVRKRKGQPRFDVLGTRGVSLYEPLVMVDYVAVDEPAKVLAASPQNISRIEVVKDDYIKGGQTYGGVVSIISKKADFAGIDLPSAGIFINFNFLSENSCKPSGYDNNAGHP